ncbi:MAG: DNA-binding transcriptional regulator [Planctomycetaceae bacterium]|jgi:LacI family transcriptional regulator|nr:DNA-binding transcriptional regulator [Planctomycetaceae bacterium]
MKPKKQVLLIIESSTSYGRGIIRGIAQYVRERNEWWIDFENRGIHEILPPILKQWNGDGIISRLYNRNFVDLIRKKKCPFIELLALEQEYTMVQIDEQYIARMAITHFLENGLKNYGYYSFGKCDWAEKRGHFFAQAVQEKGLTCSICPITPNATSSVDPVWKIEYEKTLLHWLKSLPRPVGVLTANDTHALRLVSTCRRYNIAVPEEIAVLGVNDDHQLCQTLTPTLSSIDLGSERIGYEAARLLDLQMNGQPLPKNSIILPPVQVIARQSTDMFAIENEDVVEALRFIRNYAAQGISVRDVLTACTISSRSLERNFKHYLNRTPEKEIIRVRLNHAITLLRDSQLSNKDIAQLSGFKSLRYFLQVFRQELGETPTQFRKRKIFNR